MMEFGLRGMQQKQQQHHILVLVCSFVLWHFALGITLVFKGGTIAISV
jgi:hypothetical protein